MNNNMPNNFNNEMPNNMNYNNDPMVQKANEQLIGGQSNIGNGPEVMQGISSVQNDRGIMQGYNNIQNPNGVMQGIENGSNDLSNPAPMPGQFNSGINNYTMQVESPQENSVSNEPIIPNIEPTMPNNDTSVPGLNNQQPMNINVENVPANSSVMPQMNMDSNSNIFTGLRTDNQANESINNFYQNIENPNSFQRPIVDVDVPNNQETNTMVNEQTVNPAPSNENILNNAIDTVPQSFDINQNMELNTPNIEAPTADVANINQSMPNVDISNINEENINNEATNNNIQSAMESTPKIQNPFAMNNANLQANLNGQMNNETQIPQTNIVDTPINPMPEVNSVNMDQSNEINQMTMGEPIVSPVMDQSPVMNNMNINNQIGNTQDLNSYIQTPQQPGFNNMMQASPQMNSNYENIEMPQEKVKKFPLSLRETILVTIALIGIVAVVIMYWPR